MSKKPATKKTKPFQIVKENAKYPGGLNLLPLRGGSFHFVTTGSNPGQALVVQLVHDGTAKIGQQKGDLFLKNC